MISLGPPFARGRVRPRTGGLVGPFGVIAFASAASPAAASAASAASAAPLAVVVARFPRGQTRTVIGIAHRLGSGVNLATERSVGLVIVAEPRRPLAACTTVVVGSPLLPRRSVVGCWAGRHIGGRAGGRPWGWPRLGVPGHAQVGGELVPVA